MNKHAFIKDFIAGMDPTGVSAYKRGEKSKDGSGRIAATAGGIVSGVGHAVLVPAAVGGLGYLALKNHNPGLAKTLLDTAKGATHVLNPKRFVNDIRSLPHAMHAANYAQKAMKNMKSLSHGNIFAAPGTFIRGMQYNKAANEVSKKYYNGDALDAGVAKAMSATMTGGAAGVLAGVTGLTANEQYKQGRAAAERAKTASLILEKVARDIMPFDTGNLTGYREFVRQMNRMRAPNYDVMVQRAKNIKKIRKQNRPDEEIGSAAQWVPTYI